MSSRNVLAQLLKDWAQGHDVNYKINDSDSGDTGVKNTAAFLSLMLKDGDHQLDLVDLLNRLEKLINAKRSAPKGLNCTKCNEWCQFAEPNQSNATFICYKCRI